MRVTKYQLRLDGATWIDVNSNFGLDNLPDRVPDQLAITNCSLYNLLNCAPGQRSRTFQPTYGSMWLSFIHEPIHDNTAAKMESMMLDAIEQWVPQILLDPAGTRITADTSIPGYKVRISFSTPFSPDIQQVKFEVSV
jgi:phage baseplate assembly protein W